MSVARRFHDPDARKIVLFLERIGIPVAVASVPEGSFLPGIQVSDGGLIVDPARLPYPGDLLHEAGHIALTEAEARPTLTEVSTDPGEEMAAIAWSYAALKEIGLEPEVVFHKGGYRGGARNLIENFAAGRDVGVPLLACYDLCVDWRKPDPEGRPLFPHMLRWLR